MQRIRHTLSLTIFLTSSSLLACSTPIPDQQPVGDEYIYRWTDSEGKTHFTPSWAQLPTEIQEQVVGLASQTGPSRMTMTQEGTWAP